MPGRSSAMQFTPTKTVRTAQKRKLTGKVAPSNQKQPATTAYML